VISLPPTTDSLYEVFSTRALVNVNWTSYSAFLDAGGTETPLIEPSQFPPWSLIISIDVMWNMVLLLLEEEDNTSKRPPSKTPDMQGTGPVLV
jgi:hypothetical protein